jgi:spore germination protein (amino acid permease)
MSMKQSVHENAMVSPYLLFFLIHASQTGISFLNFQSKISKGAGQDAWVSVLLMGLSLHLILYCMLHIVNNSSQGDLTSFHTDIFGRWIGGLLNVIVALLFSLLGLFVLYSYVDILQIWVFTGISAWELSFLLCLLMYYLVYGGFRIITGIAFWGVIIPSGLWLLSGGIFQYLELNHILPVFNHDWNDYVVSIKETGPMFFGFETMLIYFPYIKNGAQNSKWAHRGLLYTTALYFVVTVLSFMFFDQGKLQYLTWPTLTMIKVVSLPFMERFEFIFIFIWLLVVLPVICIYIFSATRALKRTIPQFKSSYILLFLTTCYFLFNGLAEDMRFSETIQVWVKYLGFIFIFGYIPLLFCISLLKARIGKRQKQ